MLTVVMATCNGATTLPKVLSAYCQLQTPAGGWSLIVVDDGSVDDTSKILERYKGQLPLKTLRQKRSGKNAALNLALQHVLADQETELVVFTDDDATPQPDWLIRLAECAVAQPEFAIFGGRIVPDWGAKPDEWILRLVPLGITYAITEATDGPVDPRFIWGANMAVRRSVFDAGHRFNTAIGPSGKAYAMGSETEFSRRMTAAGYRTWFCHSAVIGHYIRPEQLTEEFALARSYRFGRGARAQASDDSVVTVAGIPRWMLGKYLRELLGAIRAWITQDKDTLFRKRWELRYLRGYFYEAKQLRKLKVT